ncbi:hypothetical protein [Shewanella surugensis]|uniref:Acetoacetate decarboxylase n=1 Tax=Shewanella surugensis TaxID=212020 RepID=A0ABT0LHS7_9GAMM|nr:hypothetical protein [Shewanella surugensis]MCL1127248.1 hypothetical protein [Shewanella surugensis]
MEIKNHSDVVSGWEGGFEESNTAFAYPKPDLTSLPMPDNMFNIDKLQRQQAVKWPEFSWETEKGNADPKRCYQMFAPDISRLGYTDKGRVYSIICPQQGITSPTLGSLNVEVTVTGTRGWVNETNRELAAEMGVVGKIWFSPSAKQNPIVKLLWEYFDDKKLPLPLKKSQAIIVTTSIVKDPEQPIFPLSKGQSQDFPIPEFAQHPEAWSVGHLSVQIGSIIKTGYVEVDAVNQLIMDVFNLGSGNMLQKKNVLSWNVWFTAPELVDQGEWARHAWVWRESINADHGSPEGSGTEAKYFDGTLFKPDVDFIKTLEKTKINNFLENIEGDVKDRITGFLKDI